MLCHDVRENLSVFLDDELPNDLRDSIVKHLKQCPECLAERERLSRVTGLVRTLEIPPLESDVFSYVMASIKQKDIDKSYHVFSVMLGLFSLLAGGVVTLVYLSPLGQAILALFGSTVKNIIDVGSLIFKISSRSTVGIQGWLISLTLFFGFLLSYYGLRKVLNNTNLGGPLHE